MKRHLITALATVAPLLAAAAVLSGAHAPPSIVKAAGGRQGWLIPIPGEQLKMHATLLRPAGSGPFPLAVINHGSSQSSVERAHHPMPEYRVLSQWFLDHGYAVVLPLRPGHGETGGPYFEDQGRCAAADYAKAGQGAARSIMAAVDHLTAQPFVRKTGVIVAGQSAGGWGSLALASRNPAKVAAVINFSGGRGGRVDNRPDNNCQPDRLVKTAGDFGRTARIPSLWIYSENDSFFGPALARRMFTAYRNAGGVAEFHLLPPTGRDGHMMIYSEEAARQWQPLVGAFIATHAPAVAGPAS